MGRDEENRTHRKFVYPSTDGEESDDFPGPVRQTDKLTLRLRGKRVLPQSTPQWNVSFPSKLAKGIESTPLLVYKAIVDVYNPTPPPAPTQ